MHKVHTTATARTGLDHAARATSNIVGASTARRSIRNIVRGVTLLSLLSVLGAGPAMSHQVTPLQATRPSAGPPPQVTLVVLNSDKQPAVGVPIELIDNTPEAVFKSVGGVPANVRLSALKPGQIMFRGKTDDKGEVKIMKLAKGTYAYEAGHPDKWGYANGQIEIKDPKKTERIEIVLMKG